MNALRVLLEGAGQGVGLVLTYWALQSAAEFLRGVLERRWPEFMRRTDDVSDPRELEPEAWDHFAANAIAAGERAAEAADIADALMAERRRRYNRSLNP